MIEVFVVLDELHVSGGGGGGGVIWPSDNQHVTH